MILNTLAALTAAITLQNVETSNVMTCSVQLSGGSRAESACVLQYTREGQNEAVAFHLETGDVIMIGGTVNSAGLRVQAIESNGRFTMLPQEGQCRVSNSQLNCAIPLNERTLYITARARY